MEKTCFKDGQLTVRSNFDVLEVKLREYIDGLPKNPSTDDEFGVAEQAVKTLGEAEDAIRAALDGAVAQSASLEDVVRLGRTLAEQARTTRLALDKMVKQRKDSIRAEIVGAAHGALREHIFKLNGRLGAAWVTLPSVAIFGDAIKGKKSITSVRAACDQALATAKIEASAQADRYAENRTQLTADRDWMFLFADFATVGAKPTEDFRAIAAQRIAAHQQAEADRAEARAKAEVEALAAQAERERRWQEKIDAAKAAAAAQQSDAQPVTTTTVLVPPPGAKRVITVELDNTPPFEIPLPKPPPTLRLGAIAERLGMGITEGFLTSIGFSPAGRDKAARLYHEADFPRICAALSEHVLRVGEKGGAA